MKSKTNSKSTKSTKLFKGYKGRGMCTGCALMVLTSNGKKFCQDQKRETWKAAHNCEGIPELIDLSKKKNRRRYQLHNLLKYRLKVHARQKIVEVPHYWQPSKKNAARLKELAEMGYNIQLTI